jgi:hypothetical protein
MVCILHSAPADNAAILKLRRTLNQEVNDRSLTPQSLQGRNVAQVAAPLRKPGKPAGRRLARPQSTTRWFDCLFTKGGSKDHA